MAMENAPAVEAEVVRLVASAYEAALDPALWSSFLQGVSRRVGATASGIFLHDFADGAAPEAPSASLGVLEGFDPTAWGDYLQHYSTVNVWTQAEESLPAGVAVSSSMLYPDARLFDTEFGYDWLRPQDLFYALGGVIDRQGAIALKMTFVRPRSAGAFDGAELSLWQSLMPHVQRAADLHRRLVGAEQRARDAEAALCSLPTGTVLLGADLRARSVNDAALRLLQQDRGLFLDRHGQLVAVAADANRRLQQELRSAVQPSTMSQAHARADRTLHTKGSGGKLQATVVPLPYRSDRLPTEAAAVAFLDGRSIQTPDLMDSLVQEYGLTRAEAALAAALVGGLSLSEFAEQRRTSMNTVRTQFRAVAAKLEVSSQVDVVRVVLGAPTVRRS